ncbi:MAG TPA: 1-deoxy-D-xylulose-5-phosphate synthase [Desulfobacteraceae bacterium]|nr:1-deoxy-D-xylulose-5-phosphate synthase [Desulfobacteraceae bacterium]
MSKTILETVNHPKDLNELSLEELEQLVREIREKIIDVVSKTGGHLAPSLGVVELTVAMHYVFHAPADKIIWDVGHQAYAHKLITGRRDRFSSLRTYGGISGFPKRSESPYDTFDTGHSSTSISAGLGIATALALKGDNSKVISVIGDGSMTAGMAYEALNQAGHTQKDLIVVLNDNAMSISRNVGAISSFLSKKMSGKRFVSLKSDMENFMRSLPGVGENIMNLVRKSEDSLLSFFTPGMLFEAFKFRYVGPINGHRLDQLIDAFEHISHLKCPVLLHVLTTKGKGFEPAEKDPAHYHGVGAFDISPPVAAQTSATDVSTRQQTPPPPSYTKVFGQAMAELGARNPQLLAITAAMEEGTGLSDFAARFPERFLDVGIAEQHAVTFAAGLATEGFRPVVAIYSTFLQRAYDQVIHDVCLPNLPVVFAIDRAGLVGKDGPTHHGAFDINYLRCLPNMTILAPKDENDLRNMLYTAIQHPGPIAIRYPRGKAVGVPIESDYRAIPIGEVEVLKTGKDLIILAVGNMVHPSTAAAEALESRGLSVGVVNARFIKPVDPNLPDILANASRALVVEEAALPGGFGSAVIELLNDRGRGGIPVKRLGLPDAFVDHGSPAELRRQCGLDVEGITLAALDFCGNPR